MLIDISPQRGNRDKSASYYPAIFWEQTGVPKTW
jgi:hypothetical protein